MALPTAALFPAALAAHLAAPTICPMTPGAAAWATLATADPELLKFTADPAGGLSMYDPTRPTVRSVAISSGEKNACSLAVPICLSLALNRSCFHGCHLLKPSQISEINFSPSGRNSPFGEKIGRASCRERV